jgi:hypothetical protein
VKNERNSLWLVSGTNMERSLAEWREGAGIVLCGGGMCMRRREGARGLTKNGLYRVLRRWCGNGKDTYFWEEVWKGGEECSKSIIACFLYRWIMRVRWQTYVYR